jgi:hypothetical protein
MIAHSSIVGGSTAARLLNCPGSYAAIMALPPGSDKPSEYALEGSAMHEIIASRMNLRKAAEAAEAAEADGVDWQRDFSAILSSMPDDRLLYRELTQEHINTMISPALDALLELEKHYGGGFKVLAVERSVDFPGIPGAHGTCDLILGSNTHILHVDWKFGQGIGVRALYPDPAGDIVNAQLLFYIAAAMHSARHLFKGNKTIIGAIIQPRGDAPLTHTEITRKELKYFIDDLQHAVVKAMQRDPPRRKGEWCRWAPCKINCPLWTAPLLDLASIDAKPRTEMVSDQPTGYGAYLSRAKTLVDIVSLFKKTLDEQLHAYLEDGGKVPGWRLKPKAKQRQWIDDGIVYDALREIGFEITDIYQSKLVSFSSADATAKRLGVEIPDHLRVVPPTNETTICRTDDPAPEIHKPLAIEQFRLALAQLTAARSSN